MAISQEDCITTRQAEKKRKTLWQDHQLSLSTSELYPILRTEDLSSSRDDG
jgi:hypothetical protein